MIDFQSEIILVNLPGLLLWMRAFAMLSSHSGRVEKSLHSEHPNLISLGKRTQKLTEAPLIVFEGQMETINICYIQVTCAMQV